MTSLIENSAKKANMVVIILITLYFVITTFGCDCPKRDKVLHENQSPAVEATRSDNNQIPKMESPNSTVRPSSNSPAPQQSPQESPSSRSSIDLTSLCEQIKNSSSPPAAPGGPLYGKDPAEMAEILKNCVELKEKGLLR